MDKRFSDLKKEFNNIPTSFSDNDRNAVRSKIKELGKEPVRKKPILFPKVITGMAIAVAVLIFVVTINNQPDLFLSTGSNDNAAYENSIESADMEMHMYDADENATEELVDERNTIAQDKATTFTATNVFNPETIKENGWYGNMQVESVEDSKDSTIITFTGYGSISISGQFIDDNPLKFLPNEESLLELPIAESDVNRDIAFYFKNEDVARYYKNNMESATNGVAEFSIFGLEYHHSHDVGTKVYLTILDEFGLPSVSISEYESTIELSDELLTTYEQYSSTLDEELLKGLSPFDIFKLYHYARLENNLDVEYGLYIKNDSYEYPDKERFLSEWSDYSADQAEEHYANMLAINHFIEAYLSENEAFIHFTLDYDLGFRLHKDEELGVWKVGWLPIQ